MTQILAYICVSTKHKWHAGEEICVITGGHNARITGGGARRDPGRKGRGVAGPARGVTGPDVR